MAVATSILIDRGDSSPIVVMSPPSLREKWPKDWKVFSEICLPESMRDQQIDVRRLRQAIATRLAALHCPLCAARAPRRATSVWVRQFVRRVDPDSHPLRGE